MSPSGLSESESVPLLSGGQLWTVYSFGSGEGRGEQDNAIPNRWKNYKRSLIHVLPGPLLIIEGKPWTNFFRNYQTPIAPDCTRLLHSGNHTSTSLSTTSISSVFKE